MSKVLIKAPLLRSHTEVLATLFIVATIYFPSGEISTLYGPFSVFILLVIFHESRFTSIISSEPFPATYNTFWVGCGITHVGLTVECFISPIFILSWFIFEWSSRSSFLEIFSDNASISNNSPDIIATEYCFKPSLDILEPWGMLPVVIWVISVIVSASTTETVEGFMFPCKLKFTQYRKPVIFEICIDAGNNPRVVSPTTLFVSVEYLINFP